MAVQTNQHRKNIAPRKLDPVAEKIVWRQLVCRVFPLNWLVLLAFLQCFSGLGSKSGELRLRNPEMNHAPFRDVASISA
jgi:hypothetical protein